MQNLLDNLKNLLKKDERIVSESELLKNKIIELAIKLDKDLIQLLLADKQTKEAFFTQAGKATIFDKDKFIKFISNKQFLPDSYTAFKNKIGLTEDGNFISEKKEVVLSWPYKDCVLEGGMTKEDQKRDEVFWNETLAPDEISRLLDPKVFTNAKRIDKSGEYKFDKFKTDENGDIKDNLIIKGNNLLALQSLKKRFAGKIKLIYIDPPYNTGGDTDVFTYNNSFKHSTWLTFIKNRLDIAKELLKNDGFIAIAIDHVELFYLGSLADEVFGRENRVGVITVVHKPEGRQFAKFFSTSNEFMFVYAKNIEYANFRNVILSKELQQKFDKEDKRGKYRLDNFIRSGGGDVSLRKNKPDCFYPIYISNGLKTIQLDKSKGFHEVLPITNGGQERTWRTSKETFKKLLEDGEIIAQKDTAGKIQVYAKYREKQVIKTHWTDSRYHAIHHGTNLLESILGERQFSYPKSLYLVMDTLKLMTEEDDIILDFFSGSGTTGHATLELNKEDGGNRQFILVEQLDEHIKVATKRIQKVIQAQGGRDFVYMELAEWNEKWTDRIKKAKNGKELEKIWDELKQFAFLSYKIEPEKVDKYKKEFGELSLEQQKEFLQKECLNQNHLYINYSEIDDEEYEVDPEDKKLNKEFYGKERIYN
jgi:adenine-specific DNA-methyltransferase